MVKANRPSKKDLEDNLKKIQTELEKPEAPEEPEKPSEPVSSPSEQAPSPSAPAPSPSEPAPSPSPSEEAPSPSEPAPSPDYKKKFSASSRENQKILAKNRKLDKAIDEAQDIPEPTEQELQQEFPDWDVMTDTEKRLAKETVISRRFREKISKAREEARKIEKWKEEVDNFADDPKTLITYPELEGKTDDFRKYATQDEHNSVPFKLLVSAFLYEQQKGIKPKKGKMFETGSGGPNTKQTPKSNKISIDEARRLMNTDYKKYKEYLKAGKIDTSSIQ